MKEIVSTEHGFQDIVFSVESATSLNNATEIVCKGTYLKEKAGLKIVIDNGIKGAIKDNQLDESEYTSNAVHFFLSGVESKVFYKALCTIYNKEGNVEHFNENAKIMFNALVYSTGVPDLSLGEVRFLLSFDNKNEKGFQLQFFLIVNISSGIVTIEEKHQVFRENIVRVFGNY